MQCLARGYIHERIFRPSIGLLHISTCLHISTYSHINLYHQTKKQTLLLTDIKALRLLFAIFYVDSFTASLTVTIIIFLTRCIIAVLLTGVVATLSVCCKPPYRHMIRCHYVTVLLPFVAAARLGSLTLCATLYCPF
jgi:hypothetical protein